MIDSINNYWIKFILFQRDSRDLSEVQLFNIKIYIKQVIAM
jgi:hypothetical protein